MTRPVISAKTIEEWTALSPQHRSNILSNIRLVSRLEKWFKDRDNRPPLTEPVTSKCSKCDGEGTTVSRPRLPGIHPSKVASSCLLKIYNEMIGLPDKQERSLENVITLDIGTAVHQMLQGYGRKGAWGPYYKDEVRVSEDLQDIAHKYFLEGSADADNLLIIEDAPDYIYEVGLIHEYKTINTKGFAELTKPKPDHAEQALIYSVGLNRPVVVFLYIDKNTGAATDFPVPFNPNEWAKMENKLKRLNEFYDANEPPIASPGMFECKYCGYAYSCPYKNK